MGIKIKRERDDERQKGEPFFSSPGHDGIEATLKGWPNVSQLSRCNRINNSYGGCRTKYKGENKYS